MTTPLWEKVGGQLAKRFEAEKIKVLANPKPDPSNRRLLRGVGRSLPGDHFPETGRGRPSYATNLEWQIVNRTGDASDGSDRSEASDSESVSAIGSSGHNDPECSETRAAVIAIAKHRSAADHSRGATPTDTGNHMG